MVFEINFSLRNLKRKLQKYFILEDSNIFTETHKDTKI